MGKLTMVGNCAKEALKKNKVLLCVTGSALGIGTLCTIVAKTLEKIEKTKIDYFVKGYKSGVNVAIDAIEIKITDPSKDMESILLEAEQKNIPREIFNK